VLRSRAFNPETGAGQWTAAGAAPLADQQFLRKKDSRIIVSLKKILPAFLALIAHK
jgi:hypothetical protein